MRKIVVIGASALILCLGIVGASAEPFNPATNSYDSGNHQGNLEQYHEAGHR